MTKEHNDKIVALMREKDIALFSKQNEYNESIK
jgi:hypothetical protein